MRYTDYSTKCYENLRKLGEAISTREDGRFCLGAGCPQKMSVKSCVRWHIRDRWRIRRYMNPIVNRVILWVCDFGQGSQTNYARETNGQSQYAILDMNTDGAVGTPSIL